MFDPFLAQYIKIGTRNPKKKPRIEMILAPGVVEKHLLGMSAQGLHVDTQDVLICFSGVKVVVDLTAC